MYELREQDIRYYLRNGYLIALLYLGDGRDAFGYRVSEPISDDITEPMLERLNRRLLQEFDIAKSAKNQEYSGNLEDLQLVELADTLTAKELLDVRASI